ncbi:MAG: DUF1566 domain-containing protein [Sulfurovum sp.]|nr:DUF1566 domain-containing protein [Sulfurovum sp.]
MKKMFLIILGLSTILFAGLTKKGGIVTDSITKLQWQDDTISEELSWERAIEECAALDLGGFTDWRVPNIRELHSIVDDTRANPAITLVFQNTAQDNYWSSTTKADSTRYAFVVRFDSGNSDYYSKSSYYKKYVRCVRGGE